MKTETGLRYSRLIRENLTEEESEALLAEFTEKYWPGEQQ